MQNATSHTAIRTLSVILFLLASAWLLNGCSESHSSQEPDQHKHLNITVLLDLSDRISEKKNPEQAQRDIANIVTIVKQLKNVIEQKGAVFAKDKIKVVFYPNNYGEEAAALCGNMLYDFGAMDIQQRKTAWEEIESVYVHNLTKLYQLAAKAEHFNGSDLFSYFRHRVEDDCIEQNLNYINTLVVFSDGYLYSKDAQYRKYNRFSYIVPESQHLTQFRSREDWEVEFDSGNYGFISPGRKFHNLSVLALEFAPAQNHPKDFDIMKKYWSNWFTEMGLPENRFKIVKTDMPVLTGKLIQRYLINQVR